MLELVLYFVAKIAIGLLNPVFVPLRGDIQDWFPDFGKWFKDGFDIVIEAIKKSIDAVILIIKSSIDWMLSLIRIWIDSIASILSTIWEGLKWYIKAVWDYWSEFFQTAWDTTWEWVWWIGEWLWDTGITFLDWCIGIPFDLFMWIMKQMPGVILPEGWETGMRMFVEFGYLMNQILPVKELFALVVLWVTIMVFLTISRYVWRFVIAVIP